MINFQDQPVESPVDQTVENVPELQHCFLDPTQAECAPYWNKFLYALVPAFDLTAGMFNFSNWKNDSANN